MYTWCTREEWLDDYFDLNYIFSEHKAFPTYDEARADAEKHEIFDAMVLHGFGD